MYWVDADNELQNLRQENCILSMIKITDYGERNKSGTTIKFETKVIKSSLCGYSDAYIVVTGNMTATGGNGDTRVGFKQIAPLMKCKTRINDEHVDGAENLDIIMPMYNLIEYHYNYSDNSGTLWQFKGA